jgi:hypothetical protein
MPDLSQRSQRLRGRTVTSSEPNSTCLLPQVTLQQTLESQGLEEFVSNALCFLDWHRGDPKYSKLLFSRTK